MCEVDSSGIGSIFSVMLYRKLAACHYWVFKGNKRDCEGCKCLHTVYYLSQHPLIQCDDDNC